MLLKSAVLCLALALAGGSASAGRIPAGEVGDLESVMVMRVDSSITLDPEGKLVDFSISTDLPTTLRETLDRNVRLWHFKPVLVGGVARRVQADMRVTLAAQQATEGYTIRIDNVLFPGTKGVQPDGVAEKFNQITGKSLRPPIYPPGLMRANVQGMVLVVVRVGADGSAEEVMAKQTMLYDVRGRDKVLAKAIKILEAATLVAARQWRFNITPETAGLPAAQRTAVVPVEYSTAMHYTGDKPGVWRAVVRVPIRAVSWLPDRTDLQDIGVSDVAQGELFPLASAFGFSTPVVGTQLL